MWGKVRCTAPCEEVIQDIAGEYKYKPASYTDGRTPCCAELCMFLLKGT